MKSTLNTAIYHSPVGDMILGEYKGELCMCDWCSPARQWVLTRVLGMLRSQAQPVLLTPVILEAVGQLDEYFRHERHAFDLPLRLCGTPFQQRVWRGLLDIPYGQTMSYGQLARELGRRGAARAVAAAAKANALSVIVPCHRLIGARGTLTGYAGGLDAKRTLLCLERTAGPMVPPLF